MVEISELKLMKFFFSCIVLLFFSHEIHAQPFFKGSRDISKLIPVDSGKMRVWYALNAVDINNLGTYDDLQRLETGVHLSKYFSHFVYNSDSLCTVWSKEHKGGGDGLRRMGPSSKSKEDWTEYSYTDFFKDFITGQLTQYIYAPRFVHNISYTEVIPVQEWTIEDDTLTVAGYLCQKATCRFRGRNYIAWFTMEIPVGNGPWKFGGLPGLILKVYDADLLYTFECIRIENFAQPYPIKMYDPKNYTPLDRKKIRELMKNIDEDYFKTVGWVGASFKKSDKKAPYNPLELE